MTSDKYEQNYIEFHLRLLHTFVEKASHQPPFCRENCEQDDMDFLAALEQLPTIGGAALLIQGQELLCKIVAGYPQLMHELPRDLLWFFGGDCLHYMPDEEISLYQLLDEQRQAAQESNSNFSYENARAMVFGLH
ncbi:MAG: PA2817 family protein [Pseudomonadota bacterium]